MSDIDPRLAVAVAQAAGLDATDLERQLRVRDATDADRDGLEARVAEREARPPRAPQATPDDLAAQQRAQGEAFVQELRDALNRNRVSIPGLLDQ
jgi:hypothetical protein